MAQPKQESWYTVVRGDTLRTISRAAYGRDLSTFIEQNNYELLKNRGISDEGLRILYAGDKLYIPKYKNKYNNEPVTADFNNQVEIKLGGKTIVGAKASRIERRMNQISFGFTFECPFDYTNKNQVDLFRPFDYKTAQLYIGGELYITARACKWDFPGETATVEVRTMPGEMNECNNMRSVRHFAPGLTLLDIAKKVAEPYGIKCFSANGTGGLVESLDKNASKPGSTTQYKYDEAGKAVLAEAADVLPRIEQDPEQNDAEFIADLAKQKGFLVSSDANGNLLLWRANTQDKPVCALRQGEYPLMSASASYDGTKRFRKWAAYTEETGNPGKNDYVIDDSITVNRCFAFKASETKEANIKTAIKWRVSKSIAESCPISATVSGWRNKEGELWRENMKVTLYYPKAFVLKEREYIIEGVELTKDDSGGDIANLSLVIPESYTTTMPKPPYPWEGYYIAQNDEVGK